MKTETRINDFGVKYEVHTVEESETIDLEDNKNYKAYLELSKLVTKIEAERKAKRKAKARALILLKRYSKLKKKLEATEKEFSKIFWDDNIFYYYERTKFERKHSKLINELKED